MAAIVTAMAMIPLFDRHAIFFVDWVNHLWSIEYFGEYWKQHLHPPVTFNTHKVIGMDVPIFYSYHFYAVAGLLSSALGSGLAIRCLVFAALMLQFLVVFRSLVAIRIERNTSCVAATLLLWGIYSLTNLYNRSALTEFFAISLLTCAVSTLLVVFLKAGEEPLGRSAWLQPGFFYALAAVTHPLTAAFGALFIVGFGVLVIALTRSWQLCLFGITSAGAVMIVLSPWILAYHAFGHLLLVNDATFARHAFQTIGYFPTSLDASWSRFSPVPIDVRSLLSGVKEVSTPYLDAQVSIPLLLLVLVRLFDLRHDYARLRALDWAIGISALIFTAYFAVLSVQPSISESFGGFFNILQFAYRLTAYINLTALVVLMALTGIVARNGRSAGIRAEWLAFCLALAMAGLVTKLYHAGAIRQSSSAAAVAQVAAEIRLPAYYKEYPVWFPGMNEAGPNATTLPPTYYGHSVYSIFLAYRAAPDNAPQTYVTLAPEGSRFGDVAPFELTLPEPSLIITNVQPFPWNRLVLDGVLQPNERLLVVPPKTVLDSYRRFDGLALQLDAGRHVLEYRFVPDRLWTASIIVSWIALIIWFGAVTQRSARSGEHHRGARASRP
jgi:hypothetical protein